MWALRRRTKVRLVGAAEARAASTFVPPAASEHDRLLRELTAQPLQSWASEALRSCLEAIRDGKGHERIAVVDAWVEDADTFCLIYTPPWAAVLGGTRRRRGDLEPVSQLALATNPLAQPIYLMPEDPKAYGAMLVDDLTEPLGRLHDHLIYDADGVGWWGTLGAAPPLRPN